ncbi:MAG: DUF3581 domain-containing protein [Gammaproteobacteria bacterium]|nr:DUF3581 domain-containing protein [Gammaproteobacteria bacterium]
MYLDSFHTVQNDLIQITPEQGSRFAKEVSDDFNPLHNPDSKRFCVPGDLLFSLVLAKMGLSKKMAFNYTGMVGKGVEIAMPATEALTFTVKDNKDKAYLDVTRSDDSSHNLALIEQFSRAYVAFSGHSFPHILVPLMEQNKVMINPDRPMVIYESMAFEFDHLDISKPKLSLALKDTQLEANGKRGQVRIEFDICNGNDIIGHGFKTMVLSGLRPYDAEKVSALIELYEQSKQAYSA